VEFVDMIIEHLTTRGLVDKGVLYE